MRTFPALIATAGTLAVVGLSSLPSQAAVNAPGFTTVMIPGTSGSSEPRIAVANKDVRWAVTNESNGKEAVYHSTDGINWRKTTTPPGQTMPTTDVDVVTLPSGRVFTSELDFTGINFINTFTDDGGETWKTATGSTFADTDRQWFAAGPNNTVYMLFHNLLSGAAQHNMFVSTSTDGGATFLPPIPVTRPGDQSYLDLQCSDSGGPSGINVNPKTGQVYVFFGTRSSPVGGCAAQPVEVNVVAANREWVITAPAGGTTNPLSWTESLAVDNTASGKIVGMQLAGGGLDDAGNVYVAYPESPNAYPNYDGAAIKVVHAPANLSAWSKPFTVEPPGGVGHILPLVVGGDAGKIGLTYFSGKPGNTWVSDSAQVLDALSATPHVTHTQLSKVVVEKGTASSLMGACLSGPTATLNGFACGRSTDVNGLTIDSCGRMLAIWPAQASVSEGTYTSQQVSGATLRPKACAQAVSKPVRVPVKAPVTTPTSTGSGSLAATGGSVGLAALAVGLVGGAVLLRRRRTSL
jgi:hypothetical protein